MSRSLGHKALHKAMHEVNSYEAEGRRMFEAGMPCPPNPGHRGKEYAKWRGWQRAATEARGKKR